MRLRPLLLHALLSLALVANGMGGAMASVHAACAHDTIAAAAPAAVPAAEAPAAEPPCHEDMGADASNAHSAMPDEAMPHVGMAHDGMLHTGMHESSVSQHASTPDDEDCGDCADHCRCACIANGLAALMPPTLLLHAATGIAYTPAPSRTHAAPALPDPVRPPIG